MPLAVVVVPLHRPPTTLERFALRRCGATLSADWPTAILAPESLELANWTSLGLGDDVRRLPDRWFASRISYSALLLSQGFYEQFTDFEYLLIHQPDAFVFEDQLEDWCERGWDYVGPPFFRGYTERTRELDGTVGCGGFSLRRIKSLLDVLNSTDGRATDVAGIRGAALKVARVALRDTPVQWRLRRAFRVGRDEDRFWSTVPSWHPGFRVPPVEEAAMFGYELGGLEHMHRYYTDAVPFGCHAISDVEAIHALTVERRAPRDAREAHLADLLRRTDLL